MIHRPQHRAGLLIPPAARATADFVAPTRIVADGESSGNSKYYPNVETSKNVDLPDDATSFGAAATYSNPHISPPNSPAGTPSLSQHPDTVKPESQSSVQPALDLRRQLCDQNLFIFHLPSEWREADIKQAFGSFGNILSAKVVKRPDGSSKGYGFVCYDVREAAVAAVERMNGYSVGGKRLKVSLKKTPEECLHLQVQKLLRMSEHNEAFDRDRDCSLFVFHLPPHWDDKDLRDKFLPFGPVVAAKVSRKEDGTSRGYGFVTYMDPRAAAMAILHLNGLEVCNKRLKVQPKQVGNGPHPRPDCTVFVFHLPNDWTDSVLKQFFSHCGRVLSATVQRDPRGRSRGFGFVAFDKAQSARDAVAELNGVSVGIKRLKVSLKRSGGTGDPRQDFALDEAFASQEWQQAPMECAVNGQDGLENSTSDNWTGANYYPWKQPGGSVSGPREVTISQPPYMPNISPYSPPPYPSHLLLSPVPAGTARSAPQGLIGQPPGVLAYPAFTQRPAVWSASATALAASTPAIPFTSTHPNLSGTATSTSTSAYANSQSLFRAPGPVLSRRSLRA